MQEVELEMRKQVTVRVGDILLFSPGIEALAGEDTRFFKKYQGMKATVLGFEEDSMSTFGRMLAHAAGSEEPQKTIGRFRVKFENGYEPECSLHAVHFLVL